MCVCIYKQTAHVYIYIYIRLVRIPNNRLGETSVDMLLTM